VNLEQQFQKILAFQHTVEEIHILWHPVANPQQFCYKF